MSNLKELVNIAKNIRHTINLMKPHITNGYNINNYKYNNAILNTHQLLINEKYKQELNLLSYNMEEIIAKLEKMENNNK